MGTGHGSVIVISNSDKFPIFLDGLMISNHHFKNLDEFISTYSNFPLTTSKIIVFESGIVNVDSIKKFSDIVLDEVSQVGEILFLVGVDFKQYFNVSLDSFKNKSFLSEDITYRNLESIITETRSYELKTEVELEEVIQRKRNVDKTEVKIDKFQTRVTIDRRMDNPKKDKEKELLDKDVFIKDKVNGKVLKDGDSSEFDYIHTEELNLNYNNELLVYDNGQNIFNLLKSESVVGRKILVVDNTDSMFLSFLIENDENLKDSLKLENIYSEGVDNSNIKYYMENKDTVILRNSYNFKRSVNPQKIESLIRFIIGRYGRHFENILIVTDDIKVSWSGMARYVILPPSIDYLMKFVNYFNKDSLFQSFIVLSDLYAIKGFDIDEDIVRNYLKNLNIESVKVLDKIQSEDNKIPYILDITKIDIESEV